jgi:hypothetical protein
VCESDSKAEEMDAKEEDEFGEELVLLDWPSCEGGG